MAEAEPRCPQCSCGRRQHSFQGCVNHPTCTVTYMDLAPPGNPHSKRKK
jgi:hypothetical protein